jgi:hypothetical protein
MTRALPSFHEAWLPLPHTWPQLLRKPIQLKRSCPDWSHVVVVPLPSSVPIKSHMARPPNVCVCSSTPALDNMKIFSSCLFLLVLSPSVYAACNVSGVNENVLTGLNDLRTATPFTFTLSVAASSCATDPLTLTDALTWDVQGTPFPAVEQGVITYTGAALQTYYATFTFPGMTVTSLVPGEPLTLV